MSNAVLRVSEEGIALIKRWEGLRLTAYECAGGKWTIGYGHTRNAKPGMAISEAVADKLLRQDLDEVERAVRSKVLVPLSQHQFDALVSFVFNVGAAAFERSTLLKKLNAGRYDEVPGELMKWVYAQGKRLDGLVNRRAAEAGLWARGSFVAGRDVEADVRPASVGAAVATDTGKGTLVASLAGLVAALSQAQPVVEALGRLPWQVAVALVVASAAAVIVWRWKRE